MIEKELDIALRAYTQKPGKPHLSKYGKARHRKNFKWKLIFDCETTADAIHALRFGVYQIRRDGECVEARHDARTKSGVPGRSQNDVVFRFKH